MFTNVMFLAEHSIYYCYCCWLELYLFSLEVGNLTEPQCICRIKQLTLYDSKHHSVYVSLVWLTSCS